MLSSSVQAGAASIKEFQVGNCIKLMTNTDKGVREAAWELCAASLVENADDIDADPPANSKEAALKKLIRLVQLLNANNGENDSAGNDAASKILKKNKDLFLKIRATLPKKDREFFDVFDPLK